MAGKRKPDTPPAVRADGFLAAEIHSDEVDTLRAEVVALRTELAAALAGNGRKVKNISPIAAALLRPLKLSKEHGRQQEHPWDKIRREIVRQIVNDGRPDWSKSVHKRADAVALWCSKQRIKEPPNSDLRAMIAAVVTLLRALLP